MEQGRPFLIPFSVWASNYYKESEIKINYQFTGSGGEIRQIVEGTVDFGANDMAQKPEEVEEKKLPQFSTVFGGVVLTYNLPELKEGKLVLDGETVCKIFLSERKNWNDPRIKVLNPGLSLPDRVITSVYRSYGSGTTAIFTHYLSDIRPVWAKEIGYGTSVNFKAGIGAKGNEGVANYVKRTPYTLGYIEYACGVQNKMVVAQLKNKKGEIVSPSVERFKEAAETSELTQERHFYAWMTNADGEGAWPIVGTTYILLVKEKSEINKEVVKFFDWAYNWAYRKEDQRALKLRYMPFPEEVIAKVREYWKAQGIN